MIIRDNMKYLIIEENMLERYTKEGNIGPNNTQYVIEGVQDEKEIELFENKEI